MSQTKYLLKVVVRIEGIKSSEEREFIWRMDRGFTCKELGYRMVSGTGLVGIGGNPGSIIREKPLHIVVSSRVLNIS